MTYVPDILTLPKAATSELRVFQRVLERAMVEMSLRQKKIDRLTPRKKGRRHPANVREKYMTMENMERQKIMDRSKEDLLPFDLFSEVFIRCMGVQRADDDDGNND